MGIGCKFIVYLQGPPTHLLYPWRPPTHELYPQGALGHGSFPWGPTTPTLHPHLGNGRQGLVNHISKTCAVVSNFKNYIKDIQMW